MDTLDLLLSRRSISPALLGEPGPTDRDIAAMVAAALRAPDHGGLRPWRFAIVRGAARQRLGDVFAEAVRARDPTWTEALLERERGRPLRSPLVVACGARIRPDHKIPEIEQLLAAGAAAMNLLNAAHALGYGAMWVTGPNSYDPMVAGALGFHAPDRLVGFVHVGTPPADVGAIERPDPRAHMAEWTGA
ncbi:nitroreductase [Stella sp.]|uniref:nitroreductase family protein n=1 Tax=Stella sp. TaxID=2912054 RepID=UPI0035B40C7D